MFEIVIVYSAVAIACIVALTLGSLLIVVMIVEMIAMREEKHDRR